MTMTKAGAALLALLILAGCSRTGFREKAFGLQNRARSYAAEQKLNTMPSQTPFDGPGSGQPASTNPGAEAEADEAAATALAEGAEADKAKPAEQPQQFIYYYESPPPAAPPTQ